MLQPHDVHRFKLGWKSIATLRIFWGLPKMSWKLVPTYPTSLSSWGPVLQLHDVHPHLCCRSAPKSEAANCDKLWSCYVQIDQAVTQIFAHEIPTARPPWITLLLHASQNNKLALPHFHKVTGTGMSNDKQVIVPQNTNGMLLQHTLNFNPWSTKVLFLAEDPCR